MEFFLMSFNTYKPEVKQAIMEFAPLVEQLILKHTNRYLTEALIKKEFANNITMLSHDYYYKNHPDLSFEERVKLNYDHPNSFDTDLMIEHQ